MHEPMVAAMPHICGRAAAEQEVGWICTLERRLSHCSHPIRDGSLVSGSRSPAAPRIPPHLTPHPSTIPPHRPSPAARCGSGGGRVR